MSVKPTHPDCASSQTALADVTTAASLSLSVTVVSVRKIAEDYQ